MCFSLRIIPIDKITVWFRFRLFYFPPHHEYFVTINTHRRSQARATEREKKCDKNVACVLHINNTWQSIINYIEFFFSIIFVRWQLVAESNLFNALRAACVCGKCSCLLVFLCGKIEFFLAFGSDSRSTLAFPRIGSTTVSLQRSDVLRIKFAPTAQINRQRSSRRSQAIDSTLCAYTQQCDANTKRTIFVWVPLCFVFVCWGQFGWVHVVVLCIVFTEFWLN